MRAQTEHERELQRAHRLIADLRERLEAAERALAQARTALAQHAVAPARPARKQIGTTDSGEPVYAD